MNETNTPRTYDELLAAATKGPAEAFTHGGTVFVDLGKLLFTTPDRNAVNAELCERYWNHGPEMVAALRELMSALITRPSMGGKENPVSWNIGTATRAYRNARAVLAALDGKDAT